MKRAVRRVSRDSGGRARRRRQSVILAVLALSFLLGAVCGALTGSRGVGRYGGIFSSDGAVNADEDFLSLLFSCSRFLLAAVFFSLSLPGPVLIPLTCAVRGFVLACTVSSIASAYPESAFALTAAVLALPAALTVSGLFIVSFEGMELSLSLLSMFFHRAPAPELSGMRERVVLAFALAALAAVTQYFAVPPLLRLII